MPDLILPSLEIQNFRAFEHLRIERLGRVNLITGKNNVGKTCLLEALYLYTNHGFPYLIRELLDTRDELRSSTSSTRINQRPEPGDIDFTNIRHLFYNRPSIQNLAPLSIQIGPVAMEEQTLNVILEWRRLRERQGPDGRLSPTWELFSAQDVEDQSLKRAYIVSRMGDKSGVREAIDSVLLESGKSLLRKQFVDNEYIRNNGLSNQRVAQLWDNVTLSPLEEEVLAGLRIVAPYVNRVGMISQTDDAREPVPIITQNKERLPLHSLGDGTSRMFGIALGLVNVQNGILLVDEIETGLHYSVMPDVWRLIFQVAKRLNVQVFATTHSWDCIEAFERAAREDENADGELIHLINKNGKVLAVLYDEQELQIVTRELIEVR